ncbi:MAG: S41 family peptidase [Rhodospirillales bacterium]
MSGKFLFLLRPTSLLAVLVLGACAIPGTQDQQAQDSFAQPAAAEVIAVGFDNITDKYIEPVQLRRISIEGLRGLGTIDAGLSLTEQSNEIVMYEHTQEIGRLRFPPEADVRAWAAAVVALTEMARHNSTEIRAASSEKIYEALFDGALSDLDIFSRYAGTMEATRNRAIRDGFGGIGIRFRMEDNYAVVTRVLPATPAFESGIRPGDFIVKIDGHPIKGMSSLAVTQMIRGPVHAPLNLTLSRPEAVQPFTITVARTHIVPESVAWRVENGIGIITISSFNQETANSLEMVLNRVMAPDATPLAGLIMDLRGNPGGLLRQSVQVADLLLTQGDILSTQGRHPDSLHHYKAGGRDFAAGRPLVVLIDGKSASAAEIVAAALQDRDRAVVIGTSSYGKGSVQTVIRLPNDGEITLTWSKFVAPSGYYLHGLGVVPTICTSGQAETGDVAKIIESALQGNQAAKSVSWRRRALLHDEERQKMRDGCPAETRKGPIDVEIAKRLILNDRLHARALRMSTATAQAIN